MLPWLNIGLFALALLMIAITFTLVYSWFQRQSRRSPLPVKKIYEEYAGELSPLPIPKRFDADLPPLQHRVDEDTISLLPRSPYSLYTYWEISGEREAAAASVYHPEEWRTAPRQIRLYDITETAELEEAPFLEINIPDHADHWFIQGVLPAHRYRLAVGRLLPDRFVILLLSDAIETPAASPSPVIDPNWPPIPELAGQAVPLVMATSPVGAHPCQSTDDWRHRP
ncbi:hypothetical protein HM1_2988 [Heliomicrobium modesticaldum Ice1]|uniref:DUF4912 domain-containing protein n=1 Tax=Heliobacterium modesticaldum (strain ATCC 51547 / Ice1) TaxID=498761 RepID=B0TDH2_HELMI|nr:DUF4912 domain-containing protein [Heliomicrobium modesticaldum]ABZ85497.1 hypothetical protein HM1_2988 [Heliomicrobium modesticaldum Ice1]